MKTRKLCLTGKKKLFYTASVLKFKLIKIKNSIVPRMHWPYFKCQVATLATDNYIG